MDDAATIRLYLALVMEIVGVITSGTLIVLLVWFKVKNVVYLNRDGYYIIVSIIFISLIVIIMGLTIAH